MAMPSRSLSSSPPSTCAMMAPLARRGKNGRAVVPSSMCSLEGGRQGGIGRGAACHPNYNATTLVVMVSSRCIINGKAAIVLPASSRCCTTYQVLDERNRGKASLGTSLKVWYVASAAVSARSNSASGITGAWGQGEAGPSVGYYITLTIPVLLLGRSHGFLRLPRPLPATKGQPQTLNPMPTRKRRAGLNPTQTLTAPARMAHPKP